ncbi:MAG: hypothetical protein WBN68_00450 [Sedimenticolaceae bacterium]
MRLLVTAEQPETAAPVQAVRRIRFIARFSDREAALMHTHEILKRRLLDLDTHLYRVPLEQAVGAIESLDLNRRRTYLDGDLSVQTTMAIQAWASRYRNRHNRWDRLFEALGYVGLGLLLFNLFFLSLG